MVSLTYWGYEADQRTTGDGPDGNTMYFGIGPSVYFNGTNYGVPQSVTVTGFQDIDVENESVTITISGAGAMNPANIVREPRSNELLQQEGKSK